MRQRVKKEASEHDLCKEIFAVLWRAEEICGGRIFASHIANEGKRSIVCGARLKAIGLRTGMPDYIVCVEGRPPLLLEVKTRSGKLSTTQKDLHQRLNSGGHMVVIVHCIEDVLKLILPYVIDYHKDRPASWKRELALCASGEEFLLKTNSLLRMS